MRPLAPVSLGGRVVRLEPLKAEHVDPLYTIATATPDEFRYTSTPVTPEGRDAYFARVFKERDAALALPFVIVDVDTDGIIGTTRLTDFVWRNRNCELGFTWFAPRYFGTAVNIESKYLLLRYAFEVLELLRVEIHSDARNKRSQASIRALGATYEGTLRAHMVVKGGYVRDTLVFSIIRPDWAAVKIALEARLEAKLGGVGLPQGADAQG